MILDMFIATTRLPRVSPAAAAARSSHRIGFFARPARMSHRFTTLVGDAVAEQIRAAGRRAHTVAAPIWPVPGGDRAAG